MRKLNIIFLFLIVSLAIFIPVKAAPVILRGNGGGTGIASGTASDVGKSLVVASATESNIIWELRFASGTGSSGSGTIVFLANGQTFLTTGTIGFTAGTNVTIATSSNGTYTISATGGGGSGNGNLLVLPSSSVLANNFIFYTANGSTTVSATSSLSSVGGIIFQNGVPIFDANGFLLSGITQGSTTLALVGNLIQGGGVQFFTTSSAYLMNTAQFCAGGLQIVGTSTPQTITYPARAQINSSTPGPTGGCGPLTDGNFSQQYIWNQGTANVTIVASTSEILYYGVGTPNLSTPTSTTIKPGEIWSVTGQGRTSSSFDFYYQRFTTSTGIIEITTVSSTNVNADNFLANTEYRVTGGTNNPLIRREPNCGAPGVSWAGDPDSGFCINGSDRPAIVSGGNILLEFRPTGGTFNANVTSTGNINGATITGFNLTDCAATSTSKLIYNASTGLFYCSSDQTGAASTSSAHFATLLIAASNAKATSGADYIVSGNADDEVQAAFNALEAQGGGRLLFSEGTFTYSTTTYVSSSNVTTEGQGWGTIMKKAVGMPGYIFAVRDNNDTLRKNLHFKNFKCDGSKLDNSTGGCIDASSTAASVFMNLWLTSSNDDDLIVGPTASNTFGFNNLIIGNKIDNGSNYGIRFVRNDENIVTGNTFADHKIAHIYDTAGTQNIFGNAFVGGLNVSNAGRCIHIFNTGNTKIQDNIFDGCWQEAVYMDSVTDFSIKHNFMSHVSGASATSSMINIGSSTRGVVDGNEIEGGPFFQYAINEIGTSANNQIFLGRTEQGTSGTINSTVTSTQIYFPSPTSTLVSTAFFLGVLQDNNFGANVPVGQKFIIYNAGAAAINFFNQQTVIGASTSSDAGVTLEVVAPTGTANTVVDFGQQGASRKVGEFTLDPTNNHFTIESVQKQNAVRQLRLHGNPVTINGNSNGSVEIRVDDNTVSLSTTTVSSSITVTGFPGGIAQPTFEVASSGAMTVFNYCGGCSPFSTQRVYSFFSNPANSNFTTYGWPTTPPTLGTAGNADSAFGSFVSLSAATSTVNASSGVILTSAGNNAIQPRWSPEYSALITTGDKSTSTRQWFGLLGTNTKNWITTSSVTFDSVAAFLYDGLLDTNWRAFSSQGSASVSGNNSIDTGVLYNSSTAYMLRIKIVTPDKFSNPRITTTTVYYFIDNKLVASTTGANLPVSTANLQAMALSINAVTSTSRVDIGHINVNF